MDGIGLIWTMVIINPMVNALLFIYSLLWNFCFAIIIFTLLIQFPIIIGLYQAIIRVLAISPMQLEQLYSNIYPFINAAKLLPVQNIFLWMNLSQPERLNILGLAIPTLAVLVVITTFLQSKLMTPPSQAGQQGAQMTQAMNIYMPLLMGYLAYSFASGLSLYFITSNIASVIQYASLGKVNWRALLPGAAATEKK